MIRRFYLDGEDVSQALINAGFDLKPEDCLMTKFGAVAGELTEKARRRVRRELEDWTDVVLK